MAFFRLRNDAQTWFATIGDRPPFKTKFDQFYFCLMTGLVTGRTSEQTQAGSGATDLVDYFVEDYKAASRLLIALLLIAELKKQGIDLSEKAAVRNVFQQLISQQSPSYLTDDGVRRMNAYASGGYDYLSERRETKPNSPEEFLQDYAQLFKTAVAEAEPLDTGPR